MSSSILHIRSREILHHRGNDWRVVEPRHKVDPDHVLMLHHMGRDERFWRANVKEALPAEKTCHDDTTS
jgi:hypothetical protein